MAKGNFWGDLGDQALEFGVQSAKTIPKQVINSINPVKSVLENKNSATGSGIDPGIEKNQASQQKPKSTPLDLIGLGKKYEEQDSTEIKRYFNIVKGDEQKAINDLKREEEERKRKIEYEEEEKKRKQQQEAQEDNQADLPQGKIRKTLGMTSKKAVSDSRSERKGGKGGY
ncbi:MAG: hypothetical protein ABIO02_03880 [Patescibacteria group bacterium]